MNLRAQGTFFKRSGNGVLRVRSKNQNISCSFGGGQVLWREGYMEGFFWKNYLFLSRAGRPPSESKNDVILSGSLKRTNPKSQIYSDGCKLWAAHAKVLKRKCFDVKHVKMEFTPRTTKKNVKAHGTQCLDRFWGNLKKLLKKSRAKRVSTGIWSLTFGIHSLVRLAAEQILGRSFSRVIGSGEIKNPSCMSTLSILQV